MSVKAIILVAGQGARLRPYTDSCPKALVKLFDKPILAHQIQALNQNGIEDITLVTGYKGEQFLGYGKLVHNHEYPYTNMVHSLMLARECLLSGEDVLVSYGDIVCSVQTIQDLLKDHHDFCVVADKGWRSYWERRMPNPLDDAETFKISSARNIIELGKQPRSYGDIQAQYIGLFKMSAKIIDKVLSFYNGLDKNKIYDGQTFEQMYMTSFLQGLIDGGVDLTPVLIERGWLEIDTVQDLELSHARGSLINALH